MKFELFNPKFFYDLLRRKEAASGLRGDEWRNEGGVDITGVNSGRVALDSPLNLVEFSFNRWDKNYSMNARFHTVDETSAAFFGTSPLISRDFNRGNYRQFQSTSLDGLGSFLVYQNGHTNPPRVKAILTKGSFSDDEVRILSMGGFGAEFLKIKSYRSFLQEQQVFLDYCQVIIGAVYSKRLGERRARELDKKLVIPPYCSQR